MAPRIDRSQVHDQVALPGDPNLDCDLVGVVVTSVVAVDTSREILARMEGGSGRWCSGDKVTSVDRVTDMFVSARLPVMPEPVWRLIIRQLERWRDSGTELWFGSAPGKVSALIEDPDHYVFLPRRDDPEMGECADPVSHGGRP